MGPAKRSVRILRARKRRAGAPAKQLHWPKESRWRPVWLLCRESPGLWATKIRRKSILLLKDKKITMKQPQKVLQKVFQKKGLLSQEMTAPHIISSKNLPMGPDVEVEDSNTDDLDP
ncbi:hypothetical protein AAY473_032588, partial [Plecturocebus cupreus]